MPLFAIETCEFLKRQTAIDPDMAGCIPKEFDPTFQFKDIAFTYPDQVHFLPIAEAHMFLAPVFFLICLTLDNSRLSLVD